MSVHIMKEHPDYAKEEKKDYTIKTPPRDDEKCSLGGRVR